jgi:hypothetical protein
MATERTAVRVSSPSYQAYQMLHIGFTVLPILAGLDKFFHVLGNWNAYLTPIVPDTLGVTPTEFMMAVGVVEIGAGLLVAIMPRIGGWVVGLWLCGIIANLLMLGSYFDVALRDLGLALAAFALARLSLDYSGRNFGL